MKKITNNMINAIYKSINIEKGVLYSWRESNTLVLKSENTGLTSIYLWGNLIAQINKEGDKIDFLQVSNAGYETNTTKERLDTIVHEFAKSHIYQKNYIWYIEDSKGNKKEFPFNQMYRIIGFKI